MALRELKVCLLGDTGVGKSSIVWRFVEDSFDPNINPTIGASFMTKTVQYQNELHKFLIWDTAGQERTIKKEEQGFMPVPYYYHNSKILLSFVISCFACLLSSLLLIDSEPGVLALRCTSASPLPKACLHGPDCGSLDWTPVRSPSRHSSLHRAARNCQLSPQTVKFEGRSHGVSFAAVFPMPRTVPDLEWMLKCQSDQPAITAQVGDKDNSKLVTGRISDLRLLPSREVMERDAKDYADSIHAVFVETSAKNAININELFIEISRRIPSTDASPPGGGKGFKLRRQPSEPKRSCC
ncbi:ras-related protein Rab-22A [Pteropus vampyrus]|uniref:Ras-related protein Rab-22A n=1 Tax=Pteropus vampyrus TaxID=132908 RepID=A0A6P6CQM2_PTEVA|nr:ras-related protein Rab-22A [Pteropus vampyrus]